MSEAVMEAVARCLWRSDSYLNTKHIYKLKDDLKRTSFLLQETLQG